MKISNTSIELEVDELLEDSKGVDLPYVVTRRKKGDIVTWYGLETNWRQINGEWSKLINSQWEICERPKYEEICLQLK